MKVCFDVLASSSTLTIWVPMLVPGERKFLQKAVLTQWEKIQSHNSGVVSWLNLLERGYSWVFSEAEGGGGLNFDGMAR